MDLDNEFRILREHEEMGPSYQQLVLVLHDLEVMYFACCVCGPGSSLGVIKIKFSSLKAMKRVKSCQNQHKIPALSTNNDTLSLTKRL